VIKPILQIVPVMPSAGEEERTALRPLGRNAERYQEVLRGTAELVRAADRLGFWGVSTIEHHFHSEGYEVGPQPALLDAWWATLTERVRVGQLGYAMSSQNPIRVAEETAVLDHLTRGRCFVGFSRGSQARWTNVLGQHLGARATLSPRGVPGPSDGPAPADMARRLADDAANRRIFEEQIDIVLRAWRDESIEHDSHLWQIPYPHATGIDWLMSGVTARMGARGEVDDAGRVRRVSVVPAPYTRPHPPVFVASNASLETVAYCGQRGFVPVYFAGIGRAEQFGRAYVEQARLAGRDLAPGQSQALVRWMQIAETEAEARAAVAAYDVEIYRNLYRPFARFLAYDPAAPEQSVIDSGLWMAGSVEQVRDQFVRQWKELPAEYVVLNFHYAQMPSAAVIRSLELFVEHVKPALDELTEYSGVAEPAAG